MAKYKVNKNFINKETGQKYQADDIIELTVKRADEINATNKNKIEMVTRVDKDEKE